MELNTLGITLVMGLDFEGDKVLITAEIIEPIPARERASMKKSNSVTYVQGIGDNILDAFRDVTLKFDRKVYIAHNKVIILGEEFIKKVLITDLDFLVRDHEQRETAYLLVAKGSKAYEVMGITAGLEEIPGNYILKLIENFKYNPKSINVNLAESLKHFYDTGRQPILGVVQKQKKRQISQMGKLSENEEKYELTVIGAAAFNRERLVGYLNGEETKSFNFIMGKIKTCILTFPTPKGSSDLSRKINSNIDFMDTNKFHMSTIDVIKLKSKKDVEIVDGNVVLKVKIKIRGSIEELPGDIDISKEENIKKVEEACSKEVERALSNTLTKAQKELKSDIFGFGSAFHRKYPEEWKKIKDNWDDIFVGADFQVEAKTNVIRTGLTNTPISRVKGR